MAWLPVELALVMIIQAIGMRWDVEECFGNVSQFVASLTKRRIVP